MGFAFRLTIGLAVALAALPASADGTESKLVAAKNTAAKNTAAKNTAAKNTAAKNTAPKNTAVKNTTEEPGCIDCVYLGEHPNPPAAGFPHMFQLNQWDCEDGYSPNGPCVTCEGTFCAFPAEDTIWVDDDYLCELENCDEAGLVALSEEAIDALKQGNYGQVEMILAKSPRSVRVSKTGELEFVDCRGLVARRVSLPDGNVWRRSEE